MPRPWGGTRSGEQQIRSRVRRRLPSAYRAYRAPPAVPDTSSNPAPGAILQPGGNAVADGLAAGTAAVQLCGADIVPTRVARPTPADTADPPKFGTAVGIATIFPDRPGMPPPPPRAGISPAPNFNELISANALVTAGLTKAGLTYPPETNPFDKPELRKVPTDDPLEPSRPFNNPAIPVVAVFDPGANGFTPAADIGDESPCSALGTEEPPPTASTARRCPSTHRWPGQPRQPGRPSRPGWRSPAAS